MSLEAAIVENTQVMRELIARLTALPVPVTTPVAEAPQPEPVKPAKAEKAAKVEAAPVAQPEPTPAVKADAPLKYEDVAPQIIAFSRRDRAACVALLARYGATKLPEVKPEQYAALLAEVNGAMVAA